MKIKGISTNRKPVLKTGKVILTGSKPTGLTSNLLCRRFHLHRQMTSHALKPILLTGKVFPANTKGNRTNVQSTCGGRHLLKQMTNHANIKVNRTNVQSAAGGFHLRRQMASCVLSTSKHFQCLKTTCPSCFMQRGKRAPKSCVFDNSFDSGQYCLDRRRNGGFFEKQIKKIFIR
jgi:hypothetical protein